MSELTVLECLKAVADWQYERTQDKWWEDLALYVGVRLRKRRK